MPRITKAYHTRVVAAYKGQVTRWKKAFEREKKKKKPKPPKIVTKEKGVIILWAIPDDDPAQPTAFDELDTWPVQATTIRYRLRLVDPESGFESFIDGELEGEWEAHALGFIFRERVRAEIADWRAAHPGESPQASVVALRIEGEA